MTSVDASVLAYIRNTVGNFLTSTCTIKTPSTSKSNSYAPRVSHTPVAQNVACRVMPTSSGTTTDAQMFADKQIVGQTYRIALPYGQEIKPGYVIEIGTDVYSVVAIEQEQTDKAFVSVTAVKPS